jgi:hypothetical protein
MRAKSTSPAPKAEPPSQPHIVHENAVYSIEEFRQLFRLKQSTVRREVKLGRLRIAKRAGRYFLLGRWILHWLETAPGGRKATPASNGHIEAN